MGQTKPWLALFSLHKNIWRGLQLGYPWNSHTAVLTTSLCPQHNVPIADTQLTDHYSPRFPLTNTWIRVVSKVSPDKDLQVAMEVSPGHLISQ